MKVTLLVVFMLLAISTLQQITQAQTSEEQVQELTSRPSEADQSKVPSDSELENRLNQQQQDKRIRPRYVWCRYSGCFESYCPRAKTSFTVNEPAFAFGFLNGNLFFDMLLTMGMFNNSHIDCGPNKYRMYVYEPWPCRQPGLQIQVHDEDQCKRNCERYSDSNYQTYNERECRCECKKRCCPSSHPFWQQPPLTPHPQTGCRCRWQQSSFGTLQPKN